MTERFTRAIDQLGHVQLDVRLGGIYALERIARDSPADRAMIGEVLTAFVRSHAPWPPRLPGQYIATAPIDQVPELQVRAPDVQASLTVLSRGGFAQPEGQGDPLDLHAVDLRHADLGGDHLEGVNLSAAQLEEADLVQAHLEGANLNYAQLERADLFHAHLEEAFLSAAQLEGANLFGAQLERTDLVDAHLEGASLPVAYLEGANLAHAHLEGADLRNAHLKGASLVDAHLEGASLYGTHLEGASLFGAHLEGARASERTRRLIPRGAEMRGGCP